MRLKTGSIDTTRDGRHRVRLTMPTGERRTLDVYDTREEAETQRAAALEVLLNEGPDDGWTVKTWGEKWLTARDVGKVVADPESDWSRWNTHIVNDPIARISLKSLRRRHVRAWLDRVRAKVARQTTLNCLNVLRGLLKAALDDELIKINPAVDFKIPKEKRTEEPWTHLTLEEQWAIVLASPPPEQWIIGFAFGSGLRAGELVALRLADVHVDGEHPHVVVRYGGAPKQPTKGGKIRRVPLFGFGIESAKRWLEALPTWAKRNPNGLMFPRLRGAYRDDRHIFRWDTWKTIIETAAIARPFRWHDLRHTAGSALVSGMWGRAWTLIEVRDFLGHESVTTTERYAHLSETALKKAATETRFALFGGGGSSGLNWPQRPAARRENAERYQAASPARLELATPGLGSPRNAFVTPVDLVADGRLRAVSKALLEAVVAGDEVGAAAFSAQLGSLYVSDLTRAIELAEFILRDQDRRGSEHRSA